MPQLTQQPKDCYRTNIGNNAYVIQRICSGHNKRFNVLAEGEGNSRTNVYSGPDFGEACQRLFLDGFARHQQRQEEPEPPFLRKVSHANIN